MDKILKKLHKKLDTNVEKDFALKKHIQEMDALFKKEGLTFDEKDKLVYFKKEIAYQGIQNKKAIEQAYLEGYTKMHDYFDSLEYSEKQRLMNVENEAIYTSLPKFEWDAQSIYIPFFDVKLNAIYEKETVLFSLKQYRSLFQNYKESVQENLYGLEVYKSSFSSFDFVYGYPTKYALYSQNLGRLYFVCDDVCVDFVSVKHMDDTIMVALSEAYFNQDKETFIASLETSENVDEKLAKKLRKIG